MEKGDRGDDDYPFDDETSEGLWLHYRLERRGKSLVLLLNDQPIREALAELADRRPKLFEKRPLEVLEYFLINANKTISKRRISQALWTDDDHINDVDQCITKLRVLLKDNGRLIKSPGDQTIWFARKTKAAQVPPQLSQAPLAIDAGTPAIDSAMSSLSAIEALVRSAQRGRIILEACQPQSAPGVTYRHLTPTQT
jgi:hypothetical protein